MKKISVHRRLGLLLRLSPLLHGLLPLAAVGVVVAVVWIASGGPFLGSKNQSEVAVADTSPSVNSLEHERVDSPPRERNLSGSNVEINLNVQRQPPLSHDWISTRSALVASGLYALPLLEAHQRLDALGNVALAAATNVRSALSSCATVQILLKTPNQISAVQRRYFEAHCGSAWARAGVPPQLARMVSAQYPINESEIASLPSVAGLAHLWDGASELAAIDIWRALDVSVDFDLRATAVYLAIHNQAVLEGIDWARFRHAMPDDRITTLAYLISAKMACEEKFACSPGSPLLITLCGWPGLFVHCEINADLTQIARDSLSDREFNWWQAVARPKRAPDAGQRLSRDWQTFSE
jgi:hypothetical protein